MRATLIAAALLVAALAPCASAGDGEEAQPATPHEHLWQTLSARFDLDGDGKITWEEYQKVQSGFAMHDTNQDGAITAEDLPALLRRKPGTGLPQ